MHSVCLLLRGRTRKANGLGTAPPRRLGPHAPRKASRRTDFGIIKQRQSERTVSQGAHTGGSLFKSHPAARTGFWRHSSCRAPEAVRRTEADRAQKSQPYVQARQACEHIFQGLSFLWRAERQETFSTCLSRIIEPFYQEYYFCMQ